MAGARKRRHNNQSEADDAGTPCMQLPSLKITISARRITHTLLSKILYHMANGHTKEQQFIMIRIWDKLGEGHEKPPFSTFCARVACHSPLDDNKTHGIKLEQDVTLASLFFCKGRTAP